MSAPHRAITGHRPSTRRIRFVRTLGIAVAVAAMLPASAAAAPPEHSDLANPVIDFAAGIACEDAVRFTNSTLRANDTLFAAAADGSQRILDRGSGVSYVENLATGARFAFKGGFRILLTFAADGSLRADATGRDFLAIYFPGDDTPVGPGLFQITGTVTEWYAPDGSFLRGTFSGRKVDACTAVGSGPAS